MKKSVATFMAVDLHSVFFAFGSISSATINVMAMFSVIDRLQTDVADAIIGL